MQGGKEEVTGRERAHKMVKTQARQLTICARVPRLEGASKVYGRVRASGLVFIQCMMVTAHCNGKKGRQ